MGFVKETHLRDQNIIPKVVNSKMDQKQNESNWAERWLGWIPDLMGSGDKSGIISSGLTHVSEDATELNNSGIEARDVEGQIEIDELQYLLRGAPGQLQFKPDNWLNGLSSGTELLNEITKDSRQINSKESEYDFPRPPHKKNKSTDEFNEQSMHGPDSIQIIYYRKTYSTYFVHGRKFKSEGVSIDTIKATARDTSNFKYRGQSIIKILNE